MTENQKIGEKIATLRKNNGFTQADLGVYLNISYQAVSKWERGESCPDFATISRLAKLFNVPISYFEDGEETLPVVENTGAKVESADNTFLGVCKECGKALRQGEEGSLSPVVLCKVCDERSKQLAAERLERARKEAEERKRAEEERRQFELAQQKMDFAAKIRAAEEAKKEEERRKAAQKMRESQAKEAERKAAEEKQKYKVMAAKERRDFSFKIAGLCSGILATLFVFVGLYNYNTQGFDFLVGAFICGMVFGGFAFTYVSQLFWGGAVVDCTLYGGHVIGEPGVIFELSLEGLGFLIAVKILFAVLRFAIYLTTMLACVVAAICISPFTFVPALKRINTGDLGV